MTKRVVQSSIVALLAALLSLTFTSAALAHAGLTDVDPQPGTQVDNEAREIVFTFSEDLKEPGFASVTRDGSVDANWTFAIEAQKLVVTPKGTTPLKAGKYVVSYRVVSADGHPIKGSTDFTVVSPGENEAAPTPAASETVKKVAEPDQEEAGGFSSFVSSPWLWGSVVMFSAIVAAAIIRKKSASGDSKQDS